jgi:hypothetical protein
VEVEPAVRRRLQDNLTIRGYVGDRVYKGKLDEHVDGTGQRAIVLRCDGGWGQPDPVKTLEYPVLYVDFWADRSRRDGQATADDARTNARAVYRAADPLLHAYRNTRWGAFGSDPGLMVVSSTRWSEPTHLDATSAHGGTWLGTPLGECSVLTAAYALIVVH